MRKLTLFTFLSLPSFIFAADLSFTGTARLLAGGEPLYQELHEVSGTCTQGNFIPENQSVDYQREGSGTFATKTMSYQHSVLRPSVMFTQPEFSEVIEIINQNGETLRVIWQSPSGATEKSTLDITPSLVADSGFDNLVRDNWEQLIRSGESVKFNMVVPTRGDYYGFVLEPFSDNRIDAAHTLRIRPSSTLLSWLVDPILLGYSDQGYLTDYLGLTNIRKDEDNNYVAHIRYAIQTMPECGLKR
jgi:hypothetical protein